MNRLLEFFEEPGGGLSAQRLAFLAFVFGIIIPLTYLTFSKGAFPEIPAGVVYLFTAVIAGKVTQSFAENAAPNRPPTPPTVLPPSPGN